MIGWKERSRAQLNLRLPILSTHLYPDNAFPIDDARQLPCFSFFTAIITMPPVPLLQPRLCSKCKLLAFPGPQPYKPFSSSLPLRYDDAFTLMPEKMGWGNWWDCFTMAHTTQYLVLDNFPNLPSLKQASRQCEFCKALREILLLKVPKVDSIISNLAFSQRMRGPEPLWITIRAYHVWKNPDMDTIASLSGLHLRVVFDDNLPIEVPRPVIIKWVAEAAPSMGTRTASLHCRLGKLTSLDNEHLHTVLYLQPRQDYIRDSYLRWARGQIAECEKHDHQLADDSFCPERLLDVQGTELRLVAREEAFTAAQIPKYAALSYCWGSTDDDARAQITLTLGNLAQHQLGIRLKRLPLSVQDAVAMSRALSLRYLWVDALCISQDDPADWDRQCVDMHKIYGNAFVTLCAASSQSCRQGFLQPKPEHRILMPSRSSFAPFSGQYCLRLRGGRSRY